MTSPMNGAITRVVPVNGLLVDADLWATAHDFHRLHQQRHALYLHGPGIAQGLETVAHEPPNRTLIIYPGLAIDPAGSPILLPECERYTIQTEQPGPVHIVLQFREVAAGARGPAGPGVATHLREAYRIVEYRTPPSEPHIELARVWLTGGREPIIDAADPNAPVENQIDLRHRVESGGLVQGEVAVGLASLDSMPRPIHHNLPLRLVEALGVGTRFYGRFAGELAPRDAVGRCSLLYLAAQGEITISGDDVEGLRAFVEGGGTLLGDGCHDAKSDPFSATFNDLASKLGRTMRPVERTSPLLHEPYVFSKPPEGSTPGGLFEADGMIYAQGDFGCTLAGGRGRQTPERETIRSVLEMVVNIAAAAHRRARAHAYAADRRAP